MTDEKIPEDHQLNYYVKTIKLPFLFGLEVNIDDLVYLCCLLLAIPIGLVFRKIELKPRLKALLSSMIGLTIILLCCSKDAAHSGVLILINALILTLISPRYVHYLSFIWCFGYLVFFRMTTFFGIPQPVQFANAVQLILTLKAIGVAFEIHDTWLRKNNLIKLNDKLISEMNQNREMISKFTDVNNLSDKEKAQIEKTNVTCAQIEKIKLEMEFYSLDPKPSFINLCLYCTCHVGILTGPYFKYRTYYDWLNTKYNKYVKVSDFMLSRGKTLPIILVTYLIVSKFASFKDAKTDEFYEEPFWWRFLYMTLIFTLFKLRFYVAWILAEFSCITAGFGAYPSICKPRPGGGPTNLVELKKFDINESKDISFDFMTIHNIDEYGVETAPTVKSVLHTWNETVQYWMATFVYKRVFFRPIGQGWTMFVSAYWHGLHPGYYMSLMTCTPGIWAEQYMDKGFKQKFMSPKHYYLFDLFTWFCRCRLFDYMCMGFILLDYESTMRFWGSVYFIGHVYCIFFTILGYLLCKFGPRTKKLETDSKKKE